MSMRSSNPTPIGIVHILCLSASVRIPTAICVRLPPSMSCNELSRPNWWVPDWWVSGRLASASRGLDLRPPESGDQRRVWEAEMRSGKWLLALDGAVTSTFVEPRRRQGHKREVVALPRGERLMDRRHLENLDKPVRHERPRTARALSPRRGVLLHRRPEDSGKRGRLGTPHSHVKGSSASEAVLVRRRAWGNMGDF